MGQGFITNWGSFVLLQIGASVITNWGSLIITNQGKFYYKSGQLLQIRATVITNWGSYYKLGQTLLQIRAAITNWGNYYKLEHNIRHLFGSKALPSLKINYLRCYVQDLYTKLSAVAAVPLIMVRRNSEFVNI